jgi:hypothetical protein
MNIAGILSIRRRQFIASFYGMNLQCFQDFSLLNASDLKNELLIQMKWHFLCLFEGGKNGQLLWLVPKFVKTKPGQKLRYTIHN